jgi:ribosomal protein S18 acetylase RimI-like enzyme
MGTSVSAPTLVLRAYRGPQDHPAMTEIAEAVRKDNGDRNVGTVADMDNYYAHLDQATLPLDCGLVERDGVPVAYGRASWRPLLTGGAKIEAVINNPPAVRGSGAAGMLVEHAISRARQLVAEHSNGQPTDLVLYAEGRDHDQRAALEGRGFRVERRHAGLVRPNFADIPDLPIPEPFEVRPVDPNDHAMHRRVWDAAYVAFADTHGEEAPTEAMYDKWLKGEEFQPELWCVAFDGDRIAGQILNYLGPAEADGTVIGWTESISTQPEYRRRGLARALLARSIRIVRDAGATYAALGVDTQNPRQAQTLYESMGFRIVSESFEYVLTVDPAVSK